MVILVHLNKAGMHGFCKIDFHVKSRFSSIKPGFKMWETGFSNTCDAGVKIVLLFLFSIFGATCGCNDQNPPDRHSEIAVANSYLHAVINDLCGDRQVLSLVPPGMCPGHFDISPSQVNGLCHCKILFVFDFQKNIENAIPRIKDQGLKVCIIKPLPGLCIPETYLGIARQVATVLSEEKPEKKAHYALRLKDIENRLGNLSREISERMKESGLQNINVIVSKHQTEFIRYLGFNPVSMFAGRDTVTPAQVNRTLREADQNQVRLIISNKQEGSELAQSLADHLKVRHVVFSNFPASSRLDIKPAGFDQLLSENLDHLLGVSK